MASTLTVAIVLLFPALAAAQGGGFPDDWFFRGAERPAPLRALEGQPAPELAIAEWRGTSTTIADLRGKVVVLDFWATWCGPCMAAIPENVALVDEHGDDPLAFVGVHDANKGWETVDQVIAEKGIQYPVGKDDGGQSASAYALQFWPTYVVIDKEGVIRGAGLLPDRVKDAVAILLAEAGPPVTASPAGSFPDDWFLGGAKRSPAYRAVEGGPSPVFAPAAWLGEPIAAEALARQVVVYQFVRPELTMSLGPLAQLTAVAENYHDQGVAFVVVCDARSDFEAMAREARARKLELPVAQDASLPPTESGPGVFANQLAIRFAPVTVVVDRAGTVRAAGLRIERLPEVLDRLLAEPMPAPPAEEGANSADEPR